MGLGRLSENQALDQAGQLIPYRRDKYKIGNGKDSIDQLVESKLVHPKFVYLTTTVKNIGKQKTEEFICIHPYKCFKVKEMHGSMLGKMESQKKYYDRRS